MANEVAILMVETERPIPMICVNATGVEKGTVMRMAHPMTVTASTGDNEVFGGIAAEEKIASDGKTKIACYHGGIFKMTVGAAGTTAGHNVSISALNTVVDSAAADNDLGYAVGKSFETAVNGEFALVFVGKV